MLKLVKLYSSKENIFPEIIFHNGLNVIYATATKKTNDKKTSHSLGKSKLAEILDFMIIKKPKTGFFLKSDEIFSDFTFYLEIQTSANLYYTIQREVKGKISIYSSAQPINVIKSGVFSIVGKNLGVDAAKKALNEGLKLNVVENSLGHLRTGLRYCIRNQEEYSDIFKVKNTPENDRTWKPYLSGLLGINSDLIAGKYNARDTAKRLKTAIDELEHISSPNQNAAAIEAEISRLEESVSAMDRDLSDFSFQKIDKDITRELVDDIGQNITNLNQERYSIEQRISDINESLKAVFNFNIEDVLDIYKSIEIHLPDELVKTYDDLATLNKKMTQGRKEHLEKAKLKLIENLSSVSEELSELSSEQKKLSSLLLEKEAFKKYQKLQGIIRKDEAKLSTLRERLEKLDSATNLRARLSETNIEEAQLADKIIRASRQSVNGSIKNINSIFGGLVKDILGIDAYFYLKINKEGNPQFEVGTSDETAVYEGHSYKKVMAACFDLALLTHYSDSSYYRFSYHDGLLESLEDKVKLRLIDAWRVIAERNKLQLIITVLDADIPENSQGSKIYFKKGEIIRELHDRGDDGRLFRMKKF
ncbi:DUF2326 domain-containing protein [Pseudoteredinibacter isoporae]|uniref:Uncharacterized protein YydD (DUF2326 family) n=1 Tax=Pseudoteredinibacter isoporae TaxID=570281 RepID=A0A7X0MVI5_9GAMM|nr:DUF2326 domain-containing protein [Pseudoteredinibacter isoporae]MBB6521145.1 uncharacterized protein YydD (DUF2326 family) [Pseudoteredinibacter isoporae]NHO86706.1 DUF2326 domain-containing protein [Pseudoteredinibacter isoporae]NIB24842.1 DUF2326 domain-containing protein [Pseudoteredinibacter isoporae]